MQILYYMFYTVLTGVKTHYHSWVQKCKYNTNEAGVSLVYTYLVYQRRAKEFDVHKMWYVNLCRKNW